MTPYCYTFRWLLSEGKAEQAKKIFQKGAAVNKKTISPETLEAVTNMDVENPAEEVAF